MQLVINFRQGIGLDIEYNEDICHVIQSGEGEEDVVAFAGILIKIPFFTIYYGDFFDLDG